MVYVTCKADTQGVDIVYALPCLVHHMCKPGVLHRLLLLLDRNKFIWARAVRDAEFSCTSLYLIGNMLQGCPIHLRFRHRLHREARSPPMACGQGPSCSR